MAPPKKTPVKKTAKKVASPKKTTTPQQKPVPLYLKVIISVVLLGLVGSGVVWSIAKNKLSAMESATIKHFEKKGFVIEKGESSFSGFPFSIKLTVPKLTISKEDEKGFDAILSGRDVKFSASLWRPTHITVKGPLTYGIESKGMSVLSLKIGGAEATVSVTKDFEAEIKDWRLFDVSIFRGEPAVKLLSFKSFAIDSKTSEEGNLTRLGFDLNATGLSLPRQDDAEPVAVDKVSLKASASTPFKTREELAEALRTHKETFDKDVKKRCAEGAEFMPPLGDTIKKIQESKSKVDAGLTLKGGKYAAQVTLDGCVKNDFPNMSLKIDLENLENFLETAVESGFLSPSISRAANLFLAGIGTHDEEKDTYKATVLLQDKELKVGEKTLSKMEDLDWNKIKLTKSYCDRIAH